MNDLLADARFWIVTLGLAVVAFVKYLWAKQEKRLDVLEASTVRRKEFEQLRADLRDEHAENSGKLDEIVREMREDRKITDGHRERVGFALESIRTDVAVLKDRQGEGTFDDAGRLRR